MIKETAYKTLERVAKIADHDERKNALRELLINNNNLAIVVQRVYHPNYTFDLPAGPMPEIAKRSRHDEYGPFYNNIKRWDKFRPASEVPENVNIRQSVREEQFLSLYESVADDDADLLVAVKDKKLPWDTLNVEFVVEAVPELFPESFRAAEPEERITTRVEKTQVQSTVSKRDICKQIMQENPGLTRKDYLGLFEKAGISKVTAGQYYQALKGTV